MEIVPVTSVRLAPRAPVRVDGLPMPQALEVASTAFSGEETYTPSVLRAAAGAEEEDSDGFENEVDEESGRPVSGGRRNRVSYFV